MLEDIIMVLHTTVLTGIYEYLCVLFEQHTPLRQDTIGETIIPLFFSGTGQF